MGHSKQKGSIMPPLGLLTLAAVVRRDCPDWDVEVLDLEVHQDSTPAFDDYDAVGITGTTAHMPHAYEIVRQARNANPRALIIMGGPHATFCATHLLKNLPQLDAVVKGEGELVLAELLRKYSLGEDLPQLNGLETRAYPSPMNAPIVDDLDSLPFPAFDLVSMGSYQLATHRKTLPTPFGSFITSRGCPYTCAYCQTPQMFGQHVRAQSPGVVVDQVARLMEKHDIRSVVFWDDTFTVDRSRTLELCAGLTPLGVQWMCNTRVEAVDRDMLAAMHAAGCRIVFYGVESGSEDTLRRLDRTKKPMLNRVREVFAWTHAAGIETVGTLMIGTPYDDLQTIRRNVAFLRSLNPTHVYISIYNVTPGAREYDEALAKGRLFDRAGRVVDEPDWSDRRTYSGPPYGLPTVNPHLSRHELQQAQEYAYGQFGDRMEYL